jgi:hypothetical protein
MVVAVVEVGAMVQLSGSGGDGVRRVGDKGAEKCQLEEQGSPSLPWKTMAGWFGDTGAR